MLSQWTYVDFLQPRNAHFVHYYIQMEMCPISKPHAWCGSLMFGPCSKIQFLLIMWSKFVEHTYLVWKHRQIYPWDLWDEMPGTGLQLSSLTFLDFVFCTIHMLTVFSFFQDHVILLKLLSKPEDDFSSSSPHPKMNKELSLCCNRTLHFHRKQNSFQSINSLHLSATSVTGNINSLGNNMVITCSIVQSSWRGLFTHMIQIPPEQIFHFTVKRNWEPFCSLYCIQGEPHFKVSLGCNGFKY
jgi:hypothetical protein